MTYSNSITRTISDATYWHAMGDAATEVTVTYGYPDAPDEVLHLRFAYRRDTATLTLYTLTASGVARDSVSVHPAVMERMTVANGMPLWDGITMRAIEAFYAN